MPTVLVSLDKAVFKCSLLFLDEVVQACVRALASLSPSMLLALLQLPQLPLLALTLPDELPESEPDSHTPPPRRSVAHFRRVRAGHTPAGHQRSQWDYNQSADLIKLVSSVTAGPPFCLRGLSVFCPGFGASDLEPLQQRFLLRVPLTLRSPDFQSGSFSLSGITTTLCSGALRQQSERNLFKTSDLTVWCFITLSLFHVVLCLRASFDYTF